MIAEVTTLILLLLLWSIVGALIKFAIHQERTKDMLRTRLRRTFSFIFRKYFYKL